MTGIVEPDQAPTTGARDLQLVLCGEREGEEVCLREVHQLFQAVAPDEEPA